MELLKKLIQFAGARLREPSTMLAIGGLVTMVFGVNIPADAQSHVTTIIDSITSIFDSGQKLVASVLFLIAIFTPDRSAGLQKKVEEIENRDRIKD